MKVWRLMVFGTAGLGREALFAFGLRPSSKKQENLWRVFKGEEGERHEAKLIMGLARDHGFTWSWMQLDELQIKPRPPKRHSVAALSREGFGGKLNARPTSGSWRRRARRK